MGNFRTWNSRIENSRIWSSRIENSRIWQAKIKAGEEIQTNTPGQVANSFSPVLGAVFFGKRGGKLSKLTLSQPRKLQNQPEPPHCAFNASLTPQSPQLGVPELGFGVKNCSQLRPTNRDDPRCAQPPLGVTLR